MKHHVSTALRGIAVLLSAAAVVACGDSTGVTERELPLVTVNDRALPAPHPDADFLEVVSGQLTLRGDGSVQETVVLRCRTDLQPGQVCVGAPQQQVRTGTYSEADGWVRLDGSTYPAAFESGRVTVQYGPPPSSGFFHRSTFVFAR